MDPALKALIDGLSAQLKSMQSEMTTKMEKATSDLQAKLEATNKQLATVQASMKNELPNQQTTAAALQTTPTLLQRHELSQWLEEILL